MKRSFLHIVLLVLLLSFGGLFAQTENISFQHITIEDGLSQSTIYSILQDRKGYMWFGTSDGLNKYDGYNFTVYNHNSLDSTSISGNIITEIIEDSRGDIWIGTNEGILNRFNRDTETFDHFIFEFDTLIQSNNEARYFDYPLAFSRNNNFTITSIVEEDENHLLIGTWGNGFVRLNKTTGKTKHYYKADTATADISSNRVTDIIKENDSTYWIGTFGGGLNKMKKYVEGNSTKLYFVEYKFVPDNQNSIGSDKIISLFLDHKNTLWIGTFHGGLNRLNCSEKNLPVNEAKFIRYQYDQNKNSISGNSVMAITEDNSGSLWIGTFGAGLNQLDIMTNRFTVYKNDPFTENSLSDNDVLTVYVDNSGVLWIGTHLGKGLSKLERSSVKFGLLKRETGNSNSLNDDVVWSIWQDENDFLWIGTYKGGLNRYDRLNKQFKFYLRNNDDKFSISDNHVRAIAEDFNNNLWVGTYGAGLNCFDKSTERFYQYKSNSENKKSIGSNQIQCIYIDSNQICWIGSFGGGLNWFDINNYSIGDTIHFNKYVHDPKDPNSISDNRVYTILEGDDGTFWIGTYGGGLNKFDRETGTFTSYKFNPNIPASLSDNKVLSVFEDSFGNIWVGTNGGGLNKFDKQKEIFTRYGNAKGFDTQVIYGMLEDENNNLWISSDNGLLKYNLLSENVTYFDLNDGLQSMEYSGGAYYKNEEGEMFFGGINGLNYFHPDSVKNNTYIPPIVISEFRVFNEPIKGEIDEIVLSYDQNFFTIEYSALDYTDPDNNQYAHYLEGLETEWHYTDALLRRAVYTNLEPGTYYFHAKGSNNDGVWNQEGVTLKIEILPPFWKTWWFIMISIVGIGGLVSFLISMKVRHLLAMEKLKVRLAADLHDNVGAGLTEISILSELAAKDVNDLSETAANKLKNISETARQLVDSMSDIVWFVNPKRDSLYDLIIRLKDSYAEMLSDIGISFKAENIDKILDIKLPMDVRQNLYLIFKEGINNSIKHSKCKKINLETKLNGNQFQMILKDDGIGIKEENIKYGNGLRNMRDRAENLGGKLDIKSENSSGTTIKFTGKLSLQRNLKLGWS